MDNSIKEYGELGTAFQAYCELKGLSQLSDLKRINVFNLLHYGFNMNQIINIQKTIAVMLCGKTSNVAPMAGNVADFQQPIMSASTLKNPHTFKKEIKVLKNSYKGFVEFEFLADIPTKYFDIELNTFKYLFNSTQMSSMVADSLYKIKDIAVNDPRVYKSLRMIKASDLTCLSQYLTRMEEIRYYLSDIGLFERFVETVEYKQMQVSIDIFNNNLLMDFMEKFGSYKLKEILFKIIDNEYDFDLEEVEVAVEAAVVDESKNVAIITDENHNKNEKTDKIAELLPHIPDNLNIEFLKVCRFFSEPYTKSMNANRKNIHSIKQLSKLDYDLSSTVFQQWTIVEIQELVAICRGLSMFTQQDIKLDVVFELQSELKNTSLKYLSQLKEVENAIYLLKTIDRTKLISLFGCE